LVTLKRAGRSTRSPKHFELVKVGLP